MSNEEIITPIKVVYDVQGVDRSIRSSQRLLYTVNALRLSVEDFKRLSQDPSLSNMLWTGIQLTRVWNNLYRMVTMTNQAQRVGLSQGIIGGARGASMRRFAVGQTALGGGGLGSTGLVGTISALALANPVLAAAALIALSISTLGYRKYFIDRNSRLQREEFIKQQREITVSQGYEY